MYLSGEFKFSFGAIAPRVELSPQAVADSLAVQQLPLQGAHGDRQPLQL